MWLIPRRNIMMCIAVPMLPTSKATRITHFFPPLLSKQRSLIVFLRLSVKSVMVIASDVISRTRLVMQAIRSLFSVSQQFQ
uniref:Putative secreted protein n=1 Tax=Anopheles triannulatus TaxID=58253 RepID=A0A2M4B6C6_9DIPT